MPSIGAVWWTAEIRQAEAAADKADRLQSELDQTAEKARESNRAMNRASDSAGETSGRFGRLRNSAGRLSGTLGLLTSGIFFLITTIGNLLGVSLTLSGIWATVTGVAGTLWGILTTVGAYLAGGLSTAISTIVSLGSSFVSWLAAGSAGALAVAAAIGAAIGIAGVFILEITGVLDAVRGFAQYLRGVLSPTIRDVFLAAISLVAGPLAVIGGAITGFVQGFLRGGLEEGIRQAWLNVKQVLSIFEGAWSRTLGRVGGYISGFISDARSAFNDFTSWLGNVPSGVAQSFRNTFNAAIPSSLDIPSVTIGGGSIAGQNIPSVTIGGGSIGLPQLQTGGLIERAGAAFLHPGEAVVPAEVTRQVQGGGGGGGGTGSVTIETVEVTIGDQTLDLSTLTRSELQDLADLIGDNFGEEIESLIT
ncbi:tail length tape measure protein [Haloarcula hispanica tailed virus 2]|uniref:Tape measure n=1 Tax=Haloarcula hispanica tailed virus 2 TaxID=1273751 RepID=R4T698_9CAUD|nr:tail length tape measure protein [Haloarcula hispanica tailed virus 2]AGM11214.1 tape measure [Haloarcula hispanica tailed virus 2]